MLASRTTGSLASFMSSSFEDALDGGAGFGRGLQATKAENLLKALDLAFCLLEMMLEGPAQLIRVGPLGHLRQCLKHLLLGVIRSLSRLMKRSCKDCVAGITASSR